MSFLHDNQLELQSTGQADWDTGLGSNFQILERGFHVRATAGMAINSGQICLMNNSAYVLPYDARSVDLRGPHFMSYRSANSGEAISFVREGVVRSMTVWSGKIIPGEPFFTAIDSRGFAVSSFKSAAFPAGLAIGVDAVYFAPGKFNKGAERVTETVSVGPVIVNSYGDFSMSLMHRGIVNRVIITAQSADAYKVQFWANSTRVASELMYETLTQSSAVGSVDVRTLNYLDGAPWAYESFNTNSLSNVYGRITVQSGSSVSSSNFSVQLIAERFR